MVGADAAALVERHAGILEPQPVGERLATHRHQHRIGLDENRLAALRRLEPDVEHAVGALFDAGDLGGEPELHALLLQVALRLPRRFAVEAGQDGGEEFDHGDLGAEPAPDRAEFEPDDAAADDQ